MPLREADILRSCLIRMVGISQAAPAPEVVPTRDGYDRWAEIYDAEDNPLIRLEERHLPGLLGLIPGQAVADIGCGTGRWALRLAGQGGRVTGLDFSEGMLEKARQKGAGLDLSFLHHDLTKPIPLPDRSFDLVLSCLAMEHLPSLDLPFSEMARICRPGGRVVVTAMHPAMMLLGAEARFTDPVTGRRTCPASARHEISDYVGAGLGAGLVLGGLAEFAIDEDLMQQSERAKKYLGWPLLLILSFVS